MDTAFALLVGLFLLGSYLCEKIQFKIADKRIEEGKKRNNYIRNRYSAGKELLIANEMLRDYKKYNEIYEWFADDFEYVFGADWKEKLCLSPSGSTCDPSAHTYWVYHLILAKYGKLRNPFHPLEIGSKKDVQMNVRFAECIERHLHKAGATEIRLVLELEPREVSKKGKPTVYRSPIHLAGGEIVIESLARYETQPLW